MFDFADHWDRVRHQAHVKARAHRKKLRRPMSKAEYRRLVDVYFIWGL